MKPAVPDRSVDLRASTLRSGSAVTLPNPIVTASGTFGHGAEVARLGDAVAARRGHREVAVSPEPWPGKPAPRLHIDRAGMLNAVGLQGPGVAAWIEHDLPALRAAGRARHRVGVGSHRRRLRARRRRCCADADADVIAIEVNVSCPNLHSIRDRARSSPTIPTATRAVVGAVVDADLDLPVFAKLSPNVTDLTTIARAAVDAGARRPHPGEHGARAG